MAATILANELGFVVDEGTLTALLDEVVAVIGAALAVYGRIKATHKLSLKENKDANGS